MEVIIRTALVILLMYVGLGLYLYLNQRNFLYFPTAENNQVDANAIMLQSGDETIRLWGVNESRKPALIFFGGNAEAVEHNIDDFKRLFPNHAIYLVNYRGYGGSTGRPTEEGLYQDASSAYAYVSQSHDNVTVMGRSLGSGVATWLAANRRIDRLILVTPYDSVVAVAQAAYPVYPASLMLKDRFDSVSRAANITVPTLLLVAASDDIVPKKNTDALQAGFKSDRVRYELIPDTTHITISHSRAYSDFLSDFVSASKI